MEKLKIPGPELPANIYLTGFMGAGKSTVGRILSSKLALDFYDTDEIIAADLRMSINEIFNSKGEIFFRDKETELLKLLAENPPGSSVVSTGGGAVLRKKNRAAMSKNGLIILLEVTAEEVLRRLSGVEDRPLLKVFDGGVSLENMLEKRLPLYQKADVAIKTQGKRVEEIADEIIKAVKE